MASFRVLYTLLRIYDKMFYVKRNNYVSHQTSLYLIFFAIHLAAVSM